MNAVFYLINSSNTRLPGRSNVIWFGCKDGKIMGLSSKQFKIRDFCINREEAAKLKFIFNKLFFLFPYISIQRL